MKIELNKIELPVCLAYLPDICENGVATNTNLIQAFRKLFLDVNKEARKPTRSRQLLLDDSNIISILSRSILSAIRKNGKIQGSSENVIDLDSIEYDSPKESPKPQRDLALCTIEMIYELVRWSLFAEDSFYCNPNTVPSAGKPKKLNKVHFFSEIKCDEMITSDELKCWGFTDIEDIDPEDVPTVCHSRLSKLFMEIWGSQIIYFISNLHPMRAHIEAVAALRANHRSETGHGKLSWRALFDGQGIYWTIQSYTEHRRKSENGKQNNRPVTDVENAYDAIINDWIPEFQRERTHLYWGKSDCDDNHNAVAIRSFGVYRTMAFQIGFVMAMALLKKDLKLKSPDEFQKAVKKWVYAWNYAFKLHPKSDKGKYSLSMFDPRGDGFMGRHFGRLQKGEWIWFRYFAFEMLDAVSDKIDFDGKDEVRKNLSKMRAKYIKRLSIYIQTTEKKQGKSIDANKANEQAILLLADTLKNSLGIKKNDFKKNIDDYESTRVDTNDDETEYDFNNTEDEFSDSEYDE